ncbi:hypothetical protein LTR66_012627 [Elasticomyces elasticus]|nr:hypothetical protein LTR28_008585 [Elasticomyces elasticus]KAK4963837.1 hypothetical protein LTR66_012627 [Elasticomyces elasticus]KAK4986881.1 hypothetical protein LTR50_005012 [Elasticomyces elasticus]
MSYTLTVPKEYGYVLMTAASTFWVPFNPCPFPPPPLSQATELTNPRPKIAQWHSIRVGPFRKAAQIPYPQLYATPSQFASATSAEQKLNMYLFNCAQRSHGNFIENQPSFLAALLIAGLRYPVASSVLGAVWSLSRIVYAVGYTKKDGKDGAGRLLGSPFWLAQMALYGMAGLVGWKMVF